MNKNATKKRRRITCKSCFGSGRIDDGGKSPLRRCDDCVGNGYYHAKPQSKPAGKKLPRAKKPRAEVYHCDSPSGIYLELQGYAVTDRHYPVSVHPHATLKQARAVCKWANLTEEAKVERVKKLALIYVGPKPGSDAYIQECARRFSLAVLRAQGSL